MAGGQAITSAQGTLIGLGGGHNVAMTGSVSTGAVGIQALNRLLPLRSRKAGTGTASYLLEGKASVVSAGILVSEKSFALAGSVLTSSQGALLYRGLATLSWNPNSDRMSQVTGSITGRPLASMTRYRSMWGT